MDEDSPNESSTSISSKLRRRGRPQKPLTQQTMEQTIRFSSRPFRPRTPQLTPARTMEQDLPEEMYISSRSLRPRTPQLTPARTMEQDLPEEMSVSARPLRPRVPKPTLTQTMEEDFPDVIFVSSRPILPQPPKLTLSQTMEQDLSVPSRTLRSITRPSPTLEPMEVDDVDVVPTSQDQPPRLPPEPIPMDLTPEIPCTTAVVDRSLQQWILRVKKTFAVTKRKQETIENNLKTSLWKNNLSTTREQISAHKAKNPGIIWKSNPEAEKIKKIITQPVTPIPKFTDWTQVDRNILTPDSEFLDHLPYFEEFEEKERDQEKFMESLIEDYQGKLYSKDTNVADEACKLTDQFWLNWISRVAGVPDRNDKLFEVKNNWPVPPLIVFEAISHFIKTKLTPEQLRIKYLKIVDKFSPHLQPKVPSESDTWTKHFCGSCGIYGCLTHETDSWTTTSPHFRTTDSKNSITRKKGKSKVEAFCSESCCLKSYQCETPIPRAEWSKDEKNLFQSLYSLYSEDCCKIAGLMSGCSDKTCHEVFMFREEVRTTSNTMESSASGSSFIRETNGDSTQLQQPEVVNTCTAVKTICPDDPLPSPYVPCDHPGQRCKKSLDCSCTAVNNFCEKYCRCDDGCQNRFRGCKCLGTCDSQRCPCFLALRECIVGLCSCPAKDQSIEYVEMECKNFAIQRGRGKAVARKPSKINGWGAFAMESIKKGEFVGEYTGELISQAEGDRRGKIYDFQKTSYLFDLNKAQLIDGYRIGSILRFANHSGFPNVVGRVMVVHGDHRIGIFACRDIIDGEELLLDYRYTAQHRKGFKEPGRENKHTKKRPSKTNPNN